MALGKNLKKQQLIPDAARKDTGKDTADQRPENAVTKRRPSNEKAEGTPVKKSTSLKSKQAKQVPDRIVRYISEAERNRREQLNTRFASELKALKGRRIQMIVFRLGDEEYAVEISRTREVVVTPAISLAPHAPAYIAGIANIRGSIIMAIHLAHKFGLQRPATSGDLPGFIMVLNHTRYKAGLLINEVPSTLMVSGDDINPASGILTDDSIHETFIKGVIKKEGRLIFYLDIDELLESDRAHVVPDQQMKEKV